MKKNVVFGKETDFSKTMKELVLDLVVMVGSNPFEFSDRVCPDCLVCLFSI